MITAQRSCSGCSRAKRKCDKQTPACQRCKDRNLVCNYPASKPSCFIPLHLETPVDHGVPTVDNEIINDNADLYAFSAPSSPVAQLSSVDPSESQLCAAWFLSPESWMIDHNALSLPSTFSTSELRTFIQMIQDWFQTWVDTGSNPFIHVHLYGGRFPSSVQVAYTTLSTYIHRNSTNTDIVLRIVNERANDLVSVDDPASGTTSRSLGVIERLGRVHALFVYQAICLLDGDVRSRHLAETRFPTFVRWLTQLLECASSSLLQSFQMWQMDPVVLLSINEMNLRESLWQAWIVSESIRRTWLIGMGLHAAYVGLKQGWTPCHGGVMFTNREGVWEAKSAYTWARLCTETDVRFMQRFDAERLFSETTPAEVNDFGKAMLEITFGKDRMEEWLYYA